MREDLVEFYSEGVRVAGILRSPDGARNGAAIVQGPGWLGLKDAKLYLPYHEALTAAGFTVLIFDYRGFGDSDGDRGTLSPAMQLRDLVNAVTFVQTLDDIDPDRVGVFGSGGTGGGNAVLLAGTDGRLRCAVSQVPVADGEDWLKRMRREYEWYEYLARLDEDRRLRVTTGAGERVHPREEIMVPTPERRQTTVKKDVDGKIPTAVPLGAADEIITYRPIDVAHRAQALLVIGVVDDATTPTDHAVALYDAATEPKKLILQRKTTHYAAYAQHGEVVIPQIVDWFETHLAGRSVETTTPDGTEIIKAEA
ncbi:MAG TPA: alpha/beta fold hydrolase [Acidimicrobiia bacterium]|nr:alpha/beta fold hydrolase [Acidimicrobiia bacterium]